MGSDAGSCGGVGSGSVCSWVAGSRGWPPKYDVEAHDGDWVRVMLVLLMMVVAVDRGGSARL
ncbi:formin-like protein 6 [Iris pallida]|uniref:Formin-like protein 6 n=1 Tax=Iris pallida TaxID=29817 RepID=A0AAX6HB11_IRIPA|nr:formin-like protein 6 [Iris pallida]KAJ6838485.1 formin-like protein 6 [Iris pallida]